MREMDIIVQRYNRNKTGYHIDEYFNKDGQTHFQLSKDKIKAVVSLKDILFTEEFNFGKKVLTPKTNHEIYCTSNSNYGCRDCEFESLFADSLIEDFVDGHKEEEIIRRLLVLINKIPALLKRQEKGVSAYKLAQYKDDEEVKDRMEKVYFDFDLEEELKKLFRKD